MIYILYDRRNESFLGYSSDREFVYSEADKLNREEYNEYYLKIERSSTRQNAAIPFDEYSKNYIVEEIEKLNSH